MTLVDYAFVVGLVVIICCFSNIVRWLSRFIPAGQWQPIIDAAKEGRVRLHEGGTWGLFPPITQVRIDEDNFITVPGFIYVQCEKINEELYKAYVKEMLELMEKP